MSAKRLLLGRSDEDFETLLINTMLNFDVTGQVDNFVWETNSSGQLVLREGTTNIATFDTGTVSFNNLGAVDFNVSGSLFTNAVKGLLTGDVIFSSKTGAGFNEAYRMKENGDFFITNNVGVGVAVPLFPVDVVGDINTTTDYNIGGTQVLSATTLGSAVINSSLTSVGTLTGLLVAGNVSLTAGRSFFIDAVNVLSGATLGSGVVNSSLTNVGTLTALIVNANINITTGNDFTINGVSVVNATTLGTNVVASSLTSVGTLSSLTVSGALNATITTAAQPNITSLGTISSLSATLVTAAQPNITSLGTISSLSATLVTAAQPNITSLGTLSSLTVSGALNATLTTAAQPNITSLGTIASLNATLATAAQPNITSLGNLTTLRVNGNVGINAAATIDFAIGEADTGLDQVSAGILRVMTSNVERMRFTAGGNVGIKGATIPSINFAIVANDTGLDVTGSDLDIVVAGNIQTRFGTDGVGIGSSPITSRRLIVLGTSSVIPLQVNRLTATTTNILVEVVSNVGGTGTVNLDIAADGDVRNTNNSYGSLSDVRLKENIVDALSQWNDIKAIQFRNYNFIINPDRTHLGVIAQEIELISPGLVKTTPIEDDPNETKSVKYSILYLKGMKALQESMIRIETLESLVISMQVRLDALEAV